MENTPMHGYRPDPSNKPRGNPPSAINYNSRKKEAIEILLKIAKDCSADKMVRVEACKVLLSE